MADLKSIMNLEWVQRALDPKTPEMNGKTVFTQSSEYQGKEILYPTIRMIEGKLMDLGDKAMDFAIEKGDFITLDSPEEANKLGQMLSDLINARRKVNKPLYED
jgi:hypothetical protein